jgi:hypothetical protein
MEGQRTEALSGLSEQVLAVATNAITNAINAKIIAKAVDTDAITDVITAGLKEIRFTKEAVMQASIMGDKIGEAVETPADVRFQCCTEAPFELDRTLEVMCLVSSDVARQLCNPIPVQLPTPAVTIARFCDAMLAIG